MSLTSLPGLLSGPPLDGRPERLVAHEARLGTLPGRRAPAELIDEVESSGLLGRGGAGFPTGRKWRALAARGRGRAVVLANGAEGEPASFKDRVLMAHRPHLVLDGALLAADAIAAEEIVLYVGSEHETAVRNLRLALAERPAADRSRIRLILAPPTYVAGEASAAVHFVNASDARPTTTPPRMSERGVFGLPTLVQNVESLAAAALIARFGERAYRARGRATTRGTSLVTVSGSSRPQVREIELGSTVSELAADIGTLRNDVRAVVVGGYFGTWATIDEIWGLPLDPAILHERGLAFGCGVVGLLPATACGVAATAEITRYLAGETAGQCGPCVHGLRAISDATDRLAVGRGGSDELGRIEMLTGQIAGRGACHHPDGAIQLMTSALNVFGDEFVHHARTGRCSVTGARIHAA
jgi:NADH:ubiquinone oxidoreductase subunit F (NADH-binding)